MARCLSASRRWWTLAASMRLVGNPDRHVNMGRRFSKPLMHRLALVTVVAVCLFMAGCNGSQQANKQANKVSSLSAPIRIALDLNDPTRSTGVLSRGKERMVFKVGYGRNGVTCAGTRFEEGYTPLGRFKVNAILSQGRFAMTPALVAQSGKSEAELKQILFRNMNAIDFSGDGVSGEYGIGYVSLEPIGSVRQPFAFNTYDGKYRWYSFAIHGSNDDRRIGQKVTGGCINVAAPALKTLLSAVQLGDVVEISANGPCTP